MTAHPRWVGPCVLGWAVLAGAGPWLLRWTAGAAADNGSLLMDYVAGVAASAFVLGAALGRVRAWAPCAAAGGLFLLALAVSPSAFDDPATGFGDLSGWAFVSVFTLGPLAQLPLLMGACVGQLLSPPHED